MCVPHVYLVRIAQEMGLSALITRADLIFKKEADASRFQKNMMLFQWNVFHDYVSKEIPDQVHYIGSDLLPQLAPILSFAPTRLGVLPNKSGAGTLHNIYNVLMHDGVDKSSISYLYYFNLNGNDYEESMCLLRGNSNRSKIQGFYDYTTIPPTKEKLKSVLLSMRSKLIKFLPL